MIKVEGLTKVYGSTKAVDGLTFEIAPGRITGFLGPNGAGKSTTMRMIMGLDHATSGTALIKGRKYHDLEAPLRTVGALLEAKSFHPGRTARNHLVSLAVTNGIPLHRVDDVLTETGLTSVANTRAGNFSLGMGQRLGIAGALLGDPEILLLDEPVNGLDPEGILWIRTLLKRLAGEGRTIFVSSHLMSEMALTADHVVVIGRGQLLADTEMQDFIESSSGVSTKVKTPSPETLYPALRAAGATVIENADGSASVTGMDTREIGDVAFHAGVALHELSYQSASLEEAFMTMTNDTATYRSQSPTATQGA